MITKIVSGISGYYRRFAARDSDNPSRLYTTPPNKSNRPLVYLAAPYTHKDKNIVYERYKLVNKKTHELMCQGLSVFSPITMCHLIAEEFNLPSSFNYWKNYDLNFLSCCNTLYVLMLNGWEKSEGVAAEVAIATEMKIPIVYLES